MATEYDPKSVATISKWQRELERQQAKAEASKQNFVKTFADQLRQEEVKRQLAADAQAATKDPSRQESSRDVESLRNRSRQAGYTSEETITGFEPWLKE